MMWALVIGVWVAVGLLAYIAFMVRAVVAGQDLWLSQILKKLEGK